MNNAIETFFVWCVELMRSLANMSGMTYKDFLSITASSDNFVLWRIEVARGKNMETFTDSDETE